jgi:lysozyme
MSITIVGEQAMRANTEKRLSAHGAQLVEQFEGCVLRPYNDPWNATIGIGHLIHKGPVTAADNARYRRFTRADAIKLLDTDVRQAEEEIRQRITIPLGQNQWDATVDIVFNCGPAPLEGSFGRLLQAGDHDGAANAMLAWDHGNGGTVLEGLARRRHADRELFITPDPPYVPADEARWIHEYDSLPKWGQETWATIRRRALRRRMNKRILLLNHLANDDGGWHILNRENRYRALLARTK